jgi:hypothetical protein
VTLRSNVYLPNECATIIISGMKEACHADGPVALCGKAASWFRSGQNNRSNNAEGMWTSGMVDHVDQGFLTLWPVGNVAPDRNIVFSFVVQNPALAQNSPAIKVESRGMRMLLVQFEKEAGLPFRRPPGDPCDHAPMCNLARATWHRSRSRAPCSSKLTSPRARSTPTARTCSLSRFGPTSPSLRELS